VGAGVMGAGVAQGLAQTQHRVVLVDHDPGALCRARHNISRDYRMLSMFQKPAVAEPLEVVLERIQFRDDLAALAEVDFVIENVVEKWPVKQEVYGRIDRICRPSCVFAANTSAIPITRIGGATQRGDRVLGMHFMNPVPLKPVVEVIRGHHTSEATLATALGLLRAMGKEGIVVNDAPGFVSNRVLMLTINEAVFLLQDQVASAADVDRIFKTCFGHKMGPLETADLIGLDTILLSIEVLYESFKDSKYRPCPLLVRMVDAGLYGRKNGQGFYRYTQLPEAA
jgi:3-hydroxybutyryl-CoA dehydrogenase